MSRWHTGTEGQQQLIMGCKAVIVTALTLCLALFEVRHLKRYFACCSRFSYKVRKPTCFSTKVSANNTNFISHQISFKCTCCSWTIQSVYCTNTYLVSLFSKPLDQFGLHETFFHKNKLHLQFPLCSKNIRFFFKCSVDCVTWAI